MSLINQDLQLLSALRKNSRSSLTKISQEINLPKSTLFDKLKHHEKSIIHKHTSLVDFKKLGYISRIFITIKTTVDCRSKLNQFFFTHENVNNLFVIDSGFDFFVDAVFKDIKEKEDFLTYLKVNFPILEIYVQTVVDHVRRESFLESPI